MPKAPVSPSQPPAPPPASTDTQPAADAMPWLEEMPPRKIVAELDRYIVGQDAAKKAVAIAVRNRWRRAQAPEEIRDEIMPNNIIMIGPTGVGKTEIARRLARLAGAPFLKVEASKFTEVGYVGRDVESMIRELVDMSINMVRSEREDEVYPTAEQRAEERLLDLLLPPLPSPPPPGVTPQGAGSTEQGAGSRPLFVVSSKGDVESKLPEAETEANERRRRTREKLRAQLKDGQLEERDVEIEVQQQSFPMLEMMQPPQGMEGPDVNFIDEIDKITGQRGQSTGPDVSREGVQRDLLPIVEGSTVQTRYGYVRTDHILFIAAGAFHIAKPSDLIP